MTPADTSLRALDAPLRALLRSIRNFCFSADGKEFMKYFIHSFVSAFGAEARRTRGEIKTEEDLFAVLEALVPKGLFSSMAPHIRKALDNARQARSELVLAEPLLRGLFVAYGVLPAPFPYLAAGVCAATERLCLELLELSTNAAATYRRSRVTRGLLCMAVEADPTFQTLALRLAALNE
eukprot:gnl/Chilomastix_cuspidata/7477.p1 GENE.gnl/Chilomastix_cuspidata/7477~~gnl/Chilomastix_cuspidata/7477.p1  ORF type:complete len:180 (-),score=54.94 gnl/Chilomastix_cuspidata/7477:64-603(-)